MTESAQRPPESVTPLQQLRDTSTELLLLALSALAGMTMVLMLTLLGVLPNTAAWSAILAGPILIGTAGLNYLMLERMLLRSGPAARPLEPYKGRPRANFGFGVMIALAAMVIASTGSMALSLIQQLVFSLEVEEQETITALVERGDPFEVALLGVSAVILAPITEELLFRHMFFRRLRQEVGPVVAWTLPALAFALAHWNPAGLVVYVWLGSVFAMAYAITGRLWVAILVHAGHNAFAFTMLLLAPEALP